jgi:DNA primase large subunit
MGAFSMAPKCAPIARKASRGADVFADVFPVAPAFHPPCARNLLYIQSGHGVHLSERKRALNLKKHGLDFVDVIAVFSGLPSRSKMK